MASKPLKFIAVGVWNTVFGYGSFIAFEALCRHLGWSYLFALVFSQIVSVLNAYICYKFIVFRVTEHSWAESVRFMMVYAVYFGANLVLLPVMVNLVKIPPVPAQGIVALVLATASYVGHNFFTFRRKLAP